MYKLRKQLLEWRITTLTFEEDPELYGKERDVAITSLTKEHDVETITRISHTLYDLQKILENNSGKHPLTYKRFQSIISGMDQPPHAEETIDADLIGSSVTPISENHNKKYGIPTLKELGFDVELVEPSSFRGGETEALIRLFRHLEKKGKTTILAWVANFEKPKLSPLSPFPSQTGLSPYLRFGCLSARHFYWNLRDLYKNIKKDNEPPMALHGQLLWREFFYMAATNNPKFDQMVGNPICVQIPWDKNSEALAKWAEGKTGFPWIDAIMNQLKQEGWIHHLCRHAVAYFLTRGDLWLSWEEGMKVFDELLLDAGWSVNAGMCMWLSGSSFFHQFFHCYCPVGFGKQADPSGDYVRHYLPVLKSFPTKYIYEPWTAPESVQKAANCIIGKDYPCPMVNHAEVSQVNMQRMKQVYQYLTIKAKSKFQGVSFFFLFFSFFFN
ncbi:cryptochrome-1-like [Gigantopelta aegis]|uniref:cryptochrome-1-like n=1 Tax=Gigantopelta aegis TaxID=1735272 RepID=UPI001B88AD76|nr:cryptochrome-1-like [Gigantopelta aegis]